ncbi:hypothetical protein HHK36_025662 [Tetracentron sinense]|uniref:Uncharacterized protein n=1 Tax=Tetracentron sinense TaxID=13715 RepID=A0A835D3C3_TETSI|nr:hypothetical protein HHK36_025662 [Tetracentron sinense]
MGIGWLPWRFSSRRWPPSLIPASHLLSGQSLWGRQSIGISNFKSLPVSQSRWLIIFLLFHYLVLLGRQRGQVCS